MGCKWIKHIFRKKETSSLERKIAGQSILIDMELDDYIRNKLFDDIYVIHPHLSPNGKMNSEALSCYSTQKILFLDRNIFGHFLSALKKGTFDGAYKKQMVGLLIWSGSHDVGLSPYYAMVEAAYKKHDNTKVNKEMTLFDHIFQTIDPQTVANSFSKDGISFKAISFQDCVPKENLKILDEKWDFMLLYAAMLHFGYVLRTNNKPLDILHSFLDWYFKTEIISVIMITYVVLYCANKGMTPPHNYQDNEKIFDGCMNEARDLYLLQELDQCRYDYEKYTFMVATEDRRVAQIMSKVIEYSTLKDVNVLFSDYNEKVKKDCVAYFKKLASNRKSVKYSPSQALEIAKKQIEKEEDSLRKLINAES